MERAENENKDKKKKKRERLDVEMECLVESKEKIAPFVAYFPSGFDAQKRQKPIKEGGGEEQEEDTKIRVFRNRQFPNRLQLVVSPKDSKVDFVGASHSGEATAAQVCNYAVGILDKENQSLKIFPIAANKIFRLEPKVRGVPHELKEEEPAPEKSVNRVRDLANKYGTKTSKNQIRKWEKIRQHEGDTETQNAVESTVEGIEMNKKAMEVADVRANIPPYDTTAISPEKAYLLDKIILNGEWDLLSDSLDLLEAGKDESSSMEFCQKNKYPNFVCNRLAKLREIEDEDERSKIACIFSYITHLLRFKDLSGRQRNSMPTLRSVSMHCGIPIALFQRFYKMFVESDTNRLSDEKNDLLIRYMLVLTLFADGFETEISDIGSDLKMTPMKLREHYLQLGCKLSTIKSSTLQKSQIVTLPVPLKFPELRMPRRRR